MPDQFVELAQAARSAPLTPRLWPKPCAPRSAVTSVSTAAPALSTPPTAPTTARFPSASCFPAMPTMFWPRSPSAASSARRCSAAAEARLLPDNAATSPSSSISPNTCRGFSKSIPPAASPACSPESCSTSPRRRRKAPPHLRPRSRHARPLHSRRHDRQQLLRRAFRHGRQDRRQHRGTRNPHLRRRCA